MGQNKHWTPEESDWVCQAYVHVKPLSQDTHGQHFKDKLYQRFTQLRQDHVTANPDTDIPERTQLAVVNQLHKRLYLCSQWLAVHNYVSSLAPRSVVFEDVERKCLQVFEKVLDAEAGVGHHHHDDAVIVQGWFRRLRSSFPDRDQDWCDDEHVEMCKKVLCGFVDEKKDLGVNWMVWRVKRPAEEEAKKEGDEKHHEITHGFAETIQRARNYLSRYLDSLEETKMAESLGN
jgi:hypothetical protein